MDNKNKKASGFTIIEILVAISIFLIIVVSFMGIFNSAFTVQRKSLNSAYLLDNVSYLTDYLSRALRMAQKDVTGTCIAAKHNFEVSESRINFLNYKNECQDFFLENGELMVERNGSSQSITPANLEIENLEFWVSGESQDDLFQPKATFSLTIKTKSQPIQTINIQTTVSQRQLDIQY